MKLNIIIFILLTFLIPYDATATCDPAIAASQGYTCIDNPLGTDVNVNVLIGRVINAVMGIVGSLALAMFIYGGFIWMTAAGNNERVTKGKDILIWATIGLIVIFSAYAIVNFVLEGIAGPAQ